MTAAPGPRAILVATVGWGEIRLPAELPQPTSARLPGHPAAVDARAWAEALRRWLAEQPEHPEQLAGAMDLPRLAPVLRVLQEAGRAFDVLLVGTDQPHQAMRATDTAPLAEVLAACLPAWASVRGMHGVRAETVALRADPVDAEALWRCAEELVERAEGYDEVHLALLGGTPAMVGALVQRFAWAADDGRVQPVSWRLTATGATKDERLGVATRPGALKALTHLVDEYGFADAVLAARWSAAIPDAAAHRIEAVAGLGNLLLSLDVEDFAGAQVTALARAVPAVRDIAHDAAALRFPDTPDVAGSPSSLDSIVPLLGHCLEVLQVHWWRDEPTETVAVVHLLTEYLPHLAWESVKGHPLDPRRLVPDLFGPDIRLGAEGCPVPEHRRALATSVAAGTPLQSVKRWRQHLRRDYSQLGVLFGQCATPRPIRRFGSQINDACREPCGVLTRLDVPTRREFSDRLVLGRALGRSPLVQLRHPSPVGHFFGVPSRDEIVAALRETVEGLTGWNTATAGLPPADEVADDRFVEVVGALVGSVAGRPMPATKLLARTRAVLLDELGSAAAGQVAAVV